MDVFKRLAKGELSLASTFWRGIVLSNFFVFLILYILQTIPTTSKWVLVTVILTFFIRSIIACMVTSGIFFMLKNKKITFWSVIAFIISIINLINSTYFFILAIIYLLD